MLIWTFEILFEEYHILTYSLNKQDLLTTEGKISHLLHSHNFKIIVWNTNVPLQWTVDLVRDIGISRPMSIKERRHSYPRQGLQSRCHHSQRPPGQTDWKNKVLLYNYWLQWGRHSKGFIYPKKWWFTKAARLSLLRVDKSLCLLKLKSITVLLYDFSFKIENCATLTFVDKDMFNLQSKDFLTSFSNCY